MSKLIYYCLHLTVTILSRTHEFTILPLPFIDSSCLIYQFTISTSFTIQPLANVVVTVAINKSTISIVNVVNKLAFVNYMIYFFADSCYFSVTCKLTNNVLVVRTLAEFHRLINWFLRVLYNILKSKWSKLIPFIFCSFKSNSLRIFTKTISTFFTTKVFI